VFEDLRPYVCTFESCHRMGYLFASRHEWFDHEETYHRREWYCKPCNLVSPSHPDFERHLQQHHPGLFGSAAACERPILGPQKCPLCPETYYTPRLRRHLARHMQRLALLVLRSHQHDNASISDGEGNPHSQDTSGLESLTNPSNSSAPPKFAHRRWRGFPKLGFAYVEEGPLPITFEDHLESLASHIAEHSLEGVIPGDSPDPLEIAKRAEAEADQICAALGLSPYATPDLTKVSLYDVIVFCDDSGSMLVDNRFDDQRDVVKRISRIAHTYNRAGISLRFINSLDDDGYNRLSHGDISFALGLVFPNGTTRLGTKLLEKVVLPFVIEPARRGELRRPVLISMITDGEVLSLSSSFPLRSTANVLLPLQPTEENVDTLKWTILACKDELRKNLSAHGTPYGESAVAFQINRIGDSPESKKYLDRLANDPEVAGLIHCNDETLDAAVRTAGGHGGRLNTWVRFPPHLSVCSAG